MASIVLSFVGSQDPESLDTKKEGSIVTLVNHLLKNNQQLKQIILLYTKETKNNAHLTQEWLKEYLSVDQVKLIPVSEKFSTDPIDVALATQEARKALEEARNLANNDIFEFNSSSGTPPMKAAWGILQASGYAKNSRLWQVRNPNKMAPEQELVFENNVNIFKNEADLRVIKKQLQNYNYQGAADSLDNSDFNSSIAKVLLKYGYCRLSFDFKSAKELITPYQLEIKSQLIDNIALLGDNSILDLLQEVYYKSVTKIRTKQYADFLVLLFAFQENILRFLVQKKVLNVNSSQLDWKGIENQVRSKIKQGKLGEYIQNYQTSNGQLLRVEGELSRIVLLAILEFFDDLSELVILLKKIESYCNLRNDWVHNLKGVSFLENEKEILGTIREILEKVKPDFNPVNPFNLLNEEILNYLTKSS
ncbi:MAG: hypothetical protein VKL42_06305 [Snowella sp.]|nr:hypothetical protein [Snowella sp.]